MNWKKRITDFIGTFWTAAFGDFELVAGIRNGLSLLGKHAESSADSAFSTLIAGDMCTKEEQLPVCLYVDITEEGPEPSLDDLVSNNGGALGVKKTGAGWCCRIVTEAPPSAPLFITDHAVDYTSTLFAGADYEWYGDSILFHVRPSSLGLETCRQMDSEGRLCTCYRLFGWIAPVLENKQMVDAFETSALPECADVIWDMHQNGATMYGMKKLLGAVTGAVVCEESGTVDRVWTEQTQACMTVAGRAYHIDADGAYRMKSQGDKAEKGDILFAGTAHSGKLLVYDPMRDADSVADAFSGLLVHTDVGDMVAANEVSQARTVGSVNVLPLASGSADVDDAYVQLCAALDADPLCPHIDVPASVNPFMFILKTLRRGRAVLLSVASEDTRKLAAALQCLNRCTGTGGIVTAYVHATGDAGDLTSVSFSADAGTAAISTAATVRVSEMLAEAQTIL